MKARLRSHSHRTKLMLAASIVVAAFVTVSLLFSQPVYRGRTVDGWIRYGWLHPSEPPNIEIVFSEMGPEAVPLEVNALARSETKWTRAYKWAYLKSPLFLQERIPPPDEPVMRCLIATMALVTNKYTHQFLPDLIKLLDHPDGIVRDQAADVISHIVGPGDQAIIPVLTNAIIARKCVTYAVESLGRIGPGARMAIPTIAPLLAHNSSLKRSVTAFALLQMGTENSPKSREIESVVAANVGSLYLPDIHLDLPLTIVLRAAITNSSPTLAHFSAIVLNVGNHHLPDVLSRLRSSLTNADPNLRITAAYSLVSAGIDDDAILQQVPEAAVDLLLSRARRKDFEAQ